MKALDGIVYFGKMLYKIRLHTHNKLRADHHKNLGLDLTVASSGSCTSFTKVYKALVNRFCRREWEEEILALCFSQGRQPNAENRNLECVHCQRGLKRRGNRGIKEIEAGAASPTTATSKRSLNPKWMKKINKTVNIAFPSLSDV